jgi:prevent-host-death family protein
LADSGERLRAFAQAKATKRKNFQSLAGRRSGGTLGCGGIPPTPSTAPIDPKSAIAGIEIDTSVLNPVRFRKTQTGGQMRTINATTARQNFFKVMDEVNETSHPITVISKRNAVVIVSEQDWKDMQETIYLESIPGMKASILKGGKTPLSKCSTKPVF